MSPRWPGTIIALSFVALVPASGVAAQSSAIPGWKLVTSTDPAFSIQLPPAWSRDSASADVRATTASGDSLTVTVAAASADTDFDAYVAGVEADREKATGGDLPTVFRQPSSGLVARIDEPSTTPGTSSALFLYPPCTDGIRTLTIQGATPSTSATGRPDAWDGIAATVDPCDASAVPETTIDPEVQVLADRYFALARDSGARIIAAYAPLTRDTTLNVWHKQARKMAAIERSFVSDVEAMPWALAQRPLVDTLLTAYRDNIDLWSKGFAKAKRAKDITSRYDDLDRVSASANVAGRALRFALGLPTNPR